MTFAGISGFSQQIQTGFQSSTGDYLGFLEYKPADYQTSGKTYPLIIFLHGIGERGNGTTELSKVACCGIPRMIKLGHKMTFTWNGKTETFIVLSPQCPTKYGMWPAVFIEELIQYATTQLRVDPDRIYLTGLSMGAGGTFRFISDSKAENPKKLAAAATICAPCTFRSGDWVAQANLPFWAFHAADDDVAPASCTDAAINKVIAAKPQVQPLKTIWPTGGHIVWDRVYTDTNYVYDGVLNIYEWFLGQNRKLPVNKLPVANAGGTKTISTSQGMATLDASASYDPDGQLVRYVWKKISGPSAGVITKHFGTASSTTVTGLTVAGTYKYELSVVDDRAAFARDTLTIVVSNGPVNPPNQPQPPADPVPPAQPVTQPAPPAPAPENLPPVVQTNGDQIIPLEWNYAPLLNATPSRDPDGWIASFQWTRLSGPASYTLVNPNGGQTRVHNLVAGTYVFRVTVTDNRGAQSTADVTLTMTGKAPGSGNLPPVVQTNGDQVIPLEWNFSPLLNATLSKDPDGWIKSFRWTKISGPDSYTLATPDKGQTRVHNMKEGVYVFRVTVTDNNDAVSTADVRISMTASHQAFLDPADPDAQEQLNRVENRSGLRLWPNPTKGPAVVEFRGPGQGNGVLRILDAQGRPVKSVPVQKRSELLSTPLSFEGLPAGLYVVELSLPGRAPALYRVLRN